MNLFDNLIVDLLANFLNHTMRRMTYITDDSKVITYDNVFNHMMYDGVLIPSIIKQNKCKPTSVEQAMVTSNDIKNSYEYLDFTTVNGYTSLTCTIAGYLHKYMKETDSGDLRICVIVNTRSYTNDPMRFGNYTKPVLYTVKKSMSIDDICKLHVQSITDVQSKINDVNAHFSLNDLIKCMGYYCNFCFLPNRDICQFERNDGVNMNLCIRQNMNDIRDINKHNRHVIYLGNFDNKWMILHAINYDNYNIIECLSKQQDNFIYSQNVILD